jgi:hypothetical protein
MRVKAETLKCWKAEIGIGEARSSFSVSVFQFFSFYRRHHGSGKSRLKA